MPYPLSLAAGTLPEFGPDRVAQAAGEAGFSHVGFTIEPDKWDAAMAKRTKDAIAGHGLSVLDVEVIWIPEGGGVSDDHRAIIDVGAELGARNVLVVSSEPDTGRTAEALRTLCDHAAPAQMRVALEFLMITAIRSLDSALAVVETCDHPAAAILIDTIHFQRAGPAPDKLAAGDPALLPYAQFCDGPADCADNFDSYMTDALDLRSAPGEGELPLAEILAHLPDAIPLSLEIRSKNYRDRHPDATARAKAVREASLAWFAENGLSVA